MAQLLAQQTSTAEAQVRFPGGQNIQRPVVSDMVKFLLKTSDGRGGRPSLAIWSDSYASAKTPERERASHHPAFMGNYYSHVLSLIRPVDKFSVKEMRTWGQFKISSGSLCVLCESKELGGRISAKFPAPRKPLCRFSSSYGKLIESCT